MMKKGYKCSESKRGWFRNKSKSKYIRDSSRYGQLTSQSRPREVSEHKSKLLLTVEENKQKFEKVEKSVEQVIEMLNTNPVNVKYVEEEIIIDIKFVEASIGRRMIVDSGAPMSIVSANWLKTYIKEA